MLAHHLGAAGQMHVFFYGGRYRALIPNRTAIPEILDEAAILVTASQCLALFELQVGVELQACTPVVQQSSLAGCLIYPLHAGGSPFCCSMHLPSGEPAGGRLPLRKRLE